MDTVFLGAFRHETLRRSGLYDPCAATNEDAEINQSAGYPFRDLGVHALYLLEAFLGPIERVEAQWIKLGGDPRLPFDEWRALAHCRNGLGQRARVWRVPRPIVFAAGKFSELALALLGRKSPLGVYRLRSALARRSFASVNAFELLGWKTKVGVREGIRRIMESAGQPV